MACGKDEEDQHTFLSKAGTDLFFLPPAYEACTSQSTETTSFVEGNQTK
jgi:hypothetical protein